MVSRDIPSPRGVFAEAGIDLPPLWLVGTFEQRRRPLWVFLVEEGPALDWWRRVRAVHERTGWWPVLVGSIHNLNIEEWGTPDEYGHDEADAVGAEVVAQAIAKDFDEVLEPWPEPEPKPKPTARGRRKPAEPVVPMTERDLVGQAGTDDLVALVPAAAGYEVPGLVGWWGATNYNLRGADHVTVLHEWHRRWGAELVALGESDLELLVSRPPESDDDVRMVARQHYRYAPDKVEEFDSFDDYIARQVRAHVWEFWWD